MGETRPLRKRSDEFKLKPYAEVRELFETRFRVRGLHFLRALLDTVDFAYYEALSKEEQKKDTGAAEALVKLQERHIERKLRDYYNQLKPGVDLRDTKELIDSGKLKRTWHGAEQEKLVRYERDLPEPPAWPSSAQMGTDWGNKAQEVLLTINTFDRDSGLKPLLGQPYLLFVGTAIALHLALFIESGIQWKDVQELDEAQALFEAVIWSAGLHFVVALLLLWLWRGKHYLYERSVSSGNRQHKEVGLLFRLLTAAQVLAASAAVIVAGMVAFPPEKARSRVAMYILIGYSCASLGSVVVLSVIARVWSSWLSLPWDCWPTRVPR